MNFRSYLPATPCVKLWAPLGEFVAEAPLAPHHPNQSRAVLTVSVRPAPPAAADPGHTDAGGPGGGPRTADQVPVRRPEQAVPDGGAAGALLRHQLQDDVLTAGQSARPRTETGQATRGL